MTTLEWFHSLVAVETSVRPYWHIHKR